MTSGVINSSEKKVPPHPIPSSISLENLSIDEEGLEIERGVSAAEIATEDEEGKQLEAVYPLYIISMRSSFDHRREML